MNRERYARLREIFAELHSLDGAARSARLAALAASDDGLRAEIEGLLADSDAAVAFLARPAAGDGFSLDSWIERAGGPRGGAPDAEPLPGSIGGYTIRSVIAAGGMGVVYRAEQRSPRRTVALKLLHADLADEGARRLFEREAEALGRLQHPGIAAVYEFGSAATPAGERAFIAMEYVEGRTLLDHARENGLSAGARVDLLALVCDAVQHAHQRGIVHRDLKPGNVVVGVDGRPRVLDFGLALLVDGGARRGTEGDEGSALLGTLPYMSPERLSGDPAEVDTRCDVYALGMLAHELLAGSLPFRIENPSIDGVLLAISGSTDARSSRALRAVGSDLEVVIRKAISRDPARRYASAAALADDLRRFRRREPIAARPPSVSYQLSMLARRHATATVLLASAIGAGLFGTAWGWIGAARAREAAEAGRADAERARIEARAETARANAVRDFVLEALRVADPRNAHAAPSVAAVLSRAAEALDSRFESDPETEAELRFRLGVTFRNLGLLENAALHVNRAAALLARTLGAEHEKALEAAHAAAIVESDLGRHEAAEAALERLIEIVSRRGEPDPHFANDVRCDLAIEARHLGKFAVSEARYRDVIDRWIARSGPGEPHLVRCRSELGSLLLVIGRTAEAETLLRLSIELGERALDPTNDWLLGARNGLAQALGANGREAEAIAMHERLLADRRALFGDDHPDTLESVHNLASAYGDDGRGEEAVDLLRKAVAARARSLGARHPRTLASRNNLAQELRRAGALDEAESALREVVAAGIEVLPAGSWQCGVYRCNLGGLLLARGKVDEAEAEIRAACTALETSLGGGHPRTTEARDLLARLGRERQRKGAPPPGR